MIITFVWSISLILLSRSVQRTTRTFLYLPVIRKSTCLGVRGQNNNRIKDRWRTHCWAFRPSKPNTSVLSKENTPGACLGVPADSPLPCHTHPQGYCQGTGNRNADAHGTHSPSDKGKTNQLNSLLLNKY